MLFLVHTVASSQLLKEHARYVCFCCVGDPDDVLGKVLTTVLDLKALLPALMVLLNPFQSASSLTSEQAEATRVDFKARLQQYYLSIPPPPGLQLPQEQAQQQCQCMVSRLYLKSNLIEAAHIVPKASDQVRWLLALVSTAGNTHSHICPCAVGRLCLGYN